ncbi:MAG: AAA family ATPase [Caulobacteraceae bacterium]
MSADLAMIRAHIEAQAPPPPRLNPITLADFIAMKIPAREHVMGPWLPMQGLAMLYAPRGVGKTYMSLSIAYNAAAGQPFLRWTVPQPRRVLFVDGEMPGHALQERLVRIADQADGEPPGPDYFRLIANDLHPDGIPDLATEVGQAALTAALGDAELVVLDNLSTLCRTGRENESESWGLVQEYLLGLRREGRAVLLVHHAGKGGAQRGTSRREDVLDTVINLKRPDDYRASEGARFQVSFEKSRGFTGKEAETFEAALDPVTGIWTCRDLEDVRDARIIDLAGDGLDQKEIAAELGVHKSTISRAFARLKAEGRIA